jgi:hypothetical protein
MDKTLIHAALIILGGIFLYAVLARGLLNATEPVRGRALDLSEKILKSDRVDKELAARIEAQLNELYSNWAAWKLVFLITCTIVILPFKRFRKEPVVYNDVPMQLQDDYGKFSSCWIVATVANSPAAAILFTFIGLIGLSYLVPIGALSKLLSSHAGPFHHREAH